MVTNTSSLRPHVIFLFLHNLYIGILDSEPQKTYPSIEDSTRTSVCLVVELITTPRPRKLAAAIMKPANVAAFRLQSYHFESTFGMDWLLPRNFGTQQHTMHTSMRKGLLISLKHTTRRSRSSCIGRPTKSIPRCRHLVVALLERLSVRLNCQRDLLKRHLFRLPEAFTSMYPKDPHGQCVDTPEQCAGRGYGTGGKGCGCSLQCYCNRRLIRAMVSVTDAMLANLTSALVGSQSRCLKASSNTKVLVQVA
jgi:hypothetical protein